MRRYQLKEIIRKIIKEETSKNVRRLRESESNKIDLVKVIKSSGWKSCMSRLKDLQKEIKKNPPPSKIGKGTSTEEMELHNTYTETVLNTKWEMHNLLDLPEFWESNDRYMPFEMYDYFTYPTRELPAKLGKALSIKNKFRDKPYVELDSMISQLEWVESNIDKFNQPDKALKKVTTSIMKLLPKAVDDSKYWVDKQGESAVFVPGEWEKIFKLAEEFCRNVGKDTCDLYVKGTKMAEIPTRKSDVVQSGEKVVGKYHTMMAAAVTAISKSGIGSVEIK